ncbi:SPW repeat protein [uncultured Azohydromonas sp.]|jgi:SPW repeat.|uniref:SPW repeat protein n=1 Tax=uncultured Azohydromonas sp. TaxID=487342 RepID=UPI00262E0B0C|nr:SPW repeat protein [uncultured Azohydromonas sp.]
MLRLKHWQDGVNAVLAAWVLLSPWALGFDGERAATWNALAAGAALLAVALGAMFVPKAWENWAEAALGLWLVISPWVLGFAGLRDAMLSTALTGVVVLALAAWTLATDKDLGGWWRREAAH